MLKKLWNGDIPLVKTFWIYGWLVRSIFYFLINTLSLPQSFLLILIPIEESYVFIQLIGTWKSATKYRGRNIWKNLARIWVVIAFVFLLIGIIQFLEILVRLLSKA